MIYHRGPGYTWLTTPDVSQPGTVSAIVVVTYPDGSSEQIPVDVIISANPINNESHHGNGESNQSTVLTSNNIVGTPTNQNGNGANHVQMNDLSTAKTGQTNKSTTANENLPQTGNSNNGNNLAVLGLGLANLISMFSLGKLNDRH